MKYLKVEGHPSLIRDAKTSAILNTNMNDYNNYIKIKQMKDNEKKRIDNLENDMNDIKNDLDEIKNLLRNLSNGSK